VTFQDVVSEVRTGKLTKTECCGQWVCDDEEKYVPFSYARNSCHRNHSRYTLCSYHHNEGHSGHWNDCQKCKDDFKTKMEIFVHYGTKEYNFEKLENPPKYKPNKCSKIIVLSEGGYVQQGDKYECMNCSENPLLNMFNKSQIND
jgi:hypothetical protein